MKTLILYLLAVILLSGCITNNNEPSYIKQLTVYKEGDKNVVYFILADNNGEMTAYDVDAELFIRETLVISYEYESNLWGPYVTRAQKEQARIKLTRVNKYSLAKESFKKDDFIKTTIGLGSFKRDALIASFGRLSLNYGSKPDWRYRVKERKLCLNMSFTNANGWKSGLQIEENI